MDTTKNAARVSSLAILIAATLIDPKDFEFVIRSDVQIVLAAIVIFFIAFVDHIFGFILGLTVLVLYSRAFTSKYGISLLDNTKGGPMTPNTSEFVTPKHLVDAQSNVVDSENVYKPYKSVDTDKMYSAQGLDSSILPGLPTAPYETLGETFSTV